MADNLSNKWSTSLYVRDKDTKKEIWEGIILGPEFASNNLPVDSGYSINSFEDDFQQFIQHENFESIFVLDEVNDFVDELIYDNNISSINPRKFLDPIRVIKSEKEIEIMKKSAELASNAHIIAMKSVFSGITECHLQSIIEGHFVSNRSHWAYPSIVGLSLIHI